MFSSVKASHIGRSINNRIYVISQSDRLQIEVAARSAGCMYYMFLLFGMIWSFTFFSLLLQYGRLFFSLMGLGGIITVVISLISIWYTGKKRTILEINPRHFNLQWTSFSLRQGVLLHELKGLTSDIDWVNLNIDKNHSGNSNMVDNTCAISEGDRQYKFGNGYNLSLTEAEKVTQEISTFLRQLRS